MGCECNEFHKVTLACPFEDKINLPRNSDLFINLQAKEKGEPIDWNSGTLTLRVFENEFGGDLVFEVLDAVWNKEKSDPALSVNDVANVLVKSGAQLAPLDYATTYYLQVAFKKTATDVEAIIYRAAFKKDYK